MMLDDLDRGDVNDLEGRALFFIENESEPHYMPVAIASPYQKWIVDLDEFLRMEPLSILNKINAEQTPEGPGFVYSDITRTDRMQGFHENFPGDSHHIGEARDKERCRFRLNSWAREYIREYHSQNWWKALRKEIKVGVKDYEKPEIFKEILDHVGKDASALDLERALQLTEDLFGEEPFYDLVEDSLVMALDDQPIRDELEPRYVGLVRSLVTENYERAGNIKEVIDFYERDQAVNQ